MDKVSLNRKVKGKVENPPQAYRRCVNYIYLAPDDYTWYYFTYTRGIMQAIAADSKFNDEITKLKPDKRQSKGSKGDPSYEYILSTDRAVKNFLKKWDAAPEEDEGEKDK